MWGAELPSRPGLALEALDDELVEHQPGRDHLERDEPARAFVDREVDRPHAAVRQVLAERPVEEPVVAEGVIGLSEILRPERADRRRFDPGVGHPPPRSLYAHGGRRSNFEPVTTQGNH